MKHQRIVLAIGLCISSLLAQADEPTKLSLDKQSLEQLQQDDLRAREIIRLADRVRAPDTPFRYTLTLLEHRNGRDITENQQVLDVSMRFYKPSEQNENGDARSLVRFVSPARDKGKALLSDLDKMWYYSPDLRRPIPISRQQRLIGQVSNGDVVAADFDYSYISTLTGVEACGDKTCYKLSLERRWPYVTYPAIDYWVEKDTGHPIRADFLSAEGVLIKRSYYRDYQQVLGRMRPTTIVVEDALRKDNFTSMHYSNVIKESLPENNFQKEYLMRLNR
ncbi:outer membrane lipoprotein-sorting protein [Providencia rettgeri]|uniref:outer membrane lipoprotein-sorting protein n=1 Tax=Providencia TaxID=586 RepID=UPI001B38210B|nr:MULTISPECIES: outer membrane lipoprotein-sorting protein [Providencia]EHZ7764152.1 outer membrane lipoprotein-sorting protein [Providencia rettgeri]EIJ7167294.1 outer membrane lipoprotein-sorting protein [Providencia rettgeri]EJD6048526.1 outer membrane lipoprotein-sorting protein [Providencia rettgeri]EJD6477749.1 outer membrane lipoprotein-sorting protein [Providencia rettgeri]ELH9585634.1 outer membrane lipoprotein-sorting protein [Providencia rettgeri]